MEKQIRENKIIAILRNVPLDQTEKYLEVLYDGGIRLIEVALNSTDAFKQIEWIRTNYDGIMKIGAGTAIRTELAEKALKAGAEFLLTPSATVEVLDYCRENEVFILPGVLTPTDVDTCLKYGFNTLKLFPAGDMPKSYIKSLKGPFSETNYVAVGGVTADNITDFLKQGFIGVGIGSSLIPLEYVRNNQWDMASSYISDLVKKINE